MNLYLKQIEQLVALQQVDHEIDKIKIEMKNAPQEVELLEKNFFFIEEAHDKALEQLEHLKGQEKKLQNEIETDAQKIKKSKNKMMLVENSREYHAIVREIDNLEKINRSREEEKLTLHEALDLQNTEVDEANARYLNHKEILDAKRSSLEERLKEASAVLGGLLEHRRLAEQQVSPPILIRYDFIRERLENPVIVPVKDRICTGCHIAIPPQTYIELQRNQQILSCPNCQRLIYWCEHFHTQLNAEDE